MDHLPRFHRRKKDVATPTLITSDLSGKTTSPAPDLQPGPPMRPFQKLSPFRVFHRSSGKRARDSPPASLPHSPAAAPVLPTDTPDGRPVSPLSLKTDPAGDEGQKPANPPKMPAFLEQSEQEIENKFSELVWRERSRLMQSMTNPSPDFRWARVTGPHLKVLDRYMNVQPWHNNRIKLQVPDGHVDYINASPIVLPPTRRPTADGRAGEPQEPDRYIAMQGPKQTSVDHVWRMVAEQLESPGVIVMLTETHEGHMEKCYPYFPRSKDDPPIEINERDEFGDGFRATVRCEGMEETPAGDAIELRKLVLRVHSRPKPGTAFRAARTPEPSESGSEEDADCDVKMKSPAPTAPASAPPHKPGPTDDLPSTSDPDPAPSSPALSMSTQPQQPDQPDDRIIYHFLYKKWPDFGVPALADLDSFFTLMRLSREHNASPSNPRIVHCSAGVGRSGTFIALEHLLRELDAGVLEVWDERGGADGNGFVSGVGQEEEEESAGAAGRRGENAGPAVGEAQGQQTQTRTPQARDLIFETVDQLREQRRTMVQAESQYVFIYKVLRKLWLDRYGGGSGGDEETQGAEGVAAGDDGDADTGEPAAKRLEVDPFVE